MQQQKSQINKSSSLKARALKKWKKDFEIGGIWTPDFH